MHLFSILPKDILTNRLEELEVEPPTVQLVGDPPLPPEPQLPHMKLDVEEEF